MKDYFTPEIEVVELDDADVVSCSDGEVDFGGNTSDCPGITEAF